MDSHKDGYRSLFWPVMLIGIGALWLLGNLNLLNLNMLSMLAALWPLLLVGAGLDLLFARRSPVIGALIALLLVGAAAFVLISGASLGIQLPNAGEFKVEEFTAPIDGAQSATINLDTSSQPVAISSLERSENLLEATIGHYGQMDFLISGGADRQITLRRQPTVGFSMDFVPPQNAKWEIYLTRDIPIDLRIDSGSGSIAMDLSQTTLSAFALDSGSGSGSMVLPASADGYTAEVNSGSGSISIDLPADSTLTLRIDSGSGSVNIDLPDGAAARVEVQNGGSGAVRLPAELDRIEGDSGEDEGVWETDGFSSAQHKIEIILEDVGSGSITVR
ncbi:MAG TPA: DUF5668 domain-containing protein [Anaerolineaceae bacterium]